MDFDESEDDSEHDSFGSHSLTLERLYTWEKKLYKEVKVLEFHVLFAIATSILLKWGGILTMLQFYKDERALARFKF